MTASRRRAAREVCGVPASQPAACSARSVRGEAEELVVIVLPFELDLPEHLAGRRLQAEGDDADLSTANGNAVVTQKQWGLMAGVPDYHPACLNALNGLVEGLMDAHDQRLSLGFSAESESVPGPLTWTITSRPLGATSDGRFPA